MQDDMQKELTENIEESEMKEDPKEEESKKGFSYYHNRFKYYHYYIADKIDTFIAVVFMWILKLQIYLMGYRFQ